MSQNQPTPQGHSREFVEYLWDSQLNGRMLFLIESLMSNIHVLTQNLPLPTTEEETKMYTFHDFMINKVGQNMSVETYRRWWIEVWISRIVDALQIYLSEILLRIYTEKPEILKGSDNKVEVREVLEAGSIEEFTQRYAEQKVSGLAYRGLPKLIEYMNNSFKLQFDTSNIDFLMTCEIVEVRNIIVHNRGQISKIFLQRLPNKANDGLQVGELYPLDFMYAVDANNYLERFVATLDQLIVEHFKLDPFLGPRLTKLRTTN
ncbi:MAG: hypothetical protein NVSMB54_37700 [Ktedonobacteraceae bacterium]